MSLTYRPLTIADKMFIEENISLSVRKLGKLLNKPQSTISKYKVSFRGLLSTTDRYLLTDAEIKFQIANDAKNFGLSVNKLRLKYGRSDLFVRTALRRFGLKARLIDPVSLQGAGTYSYKCDKVTCAYCRAMDI